MDFDFPYSGLGSVKTGSSRGERLSCTIRRRSSPVADGNFVQFGVSLKVNLLWLLSHWQRHGHAMAVRAYSARLMRRLRKLRRASDS
jgi:hypothetical protein